MHVAQYLLGSLRKHGAAASTRYTEYAASVQQEVDRMETEVGEARRRRETEEELELLRELEQRDDLRWLYAKAAEVMREVSAVVSAVELRSVGAKEGITQIC